jgi:hypothetical protein
LIGICHNIRRPEVIGVDISHDRCAARRAIYELLIDSRQKGVAVKNVFGRSGVIRAALRRGGDGEPLERIRCCGCCTGDLVDARTKGVIAEGGGCSVGKNSC